MSTLYAAPKDRWRLTVTARRLLRLGGLTRGRHGMRKPTFRRFAAGGATVVTLLAVALGAQAYWSTQGTASASGQVGGLNPPTGVTTSSFGPDVTVNWTEEPGPEGVVDGYAVTRYSGGTPSAACGTSPSTLLPAGTTTCTESPVADGRHTYTVTAYFRTWTAESAQSNSVNVVAAEILPSQTVSLSPGATNAYLTGTTLYYRASVPGSLQLVDTLTAPAGAASATFPDINAAGWTHGAETVTVGTGADPTIAYTSSSYAWTASPATPAVHTITGTDARAQTVDSVLTFTPDGAAPTGAALSVNGTVADGTGTTSRANATFNVDVRTDYADSGSGLASSILTREYATLADDVCGAFGSAVELPGAPRQSGLISGCYRYTLTGVDNVGNAASLSTTVKYDAVLPTQAVTLTSGVAASMTGTVIYFRNSVAGSFSLGSSLSDTHSGPVSVTFPVVTRAGWTHPAETVTSGTGSAPTVTYASSTYSFASGSNSPTSHSIVGLDRAGNSVTTAVSFTNDVYGPSAGALTVNGSAASAVGTDSFNTTGSFAIGARTDYTDAQSGIASSVLTMSYSPWSGGSCGTYGSSAIVEGAPAQSALADGCWRYVLTGTDNVGNVSSLTTVVKVDTFAPTGGAVTVNGLAADVAGTTSVSSATFYPIDSRTDWTDSGSGVTTTLVRTVAPWSGGNCGTFATATTLIGTPNQTVSTSCYRYTLTGTDAAGNSATVFTIVKNDSTAPTAGALTVNGTAASAVGTTSSANVVSFTIGTRTANTDSGSGLASSVLTRQYAVLSGTTCSTFGATTEIVGTPAQAGLSAGCYMYTLTGTDNFGNTSAINTTVKLGVYVASLSLTNGIGTTARVDQGDQVVITFSDDISVSTLCSAWSGDLTDQVLSADNEVTVTLTNGSGPNNDSITVTSSACTLNFGSLALGSKNYTTATVAFGGSATNRSTVEWSAAAKRLTVTLGQVSGAGPAVAAATAVTYTPSTAVQSIGGIPAGGNFGSASGTQF